MQDQRTEQPVMVRTLAEVEGDSTLSGNRMMLAVVERDGRLYVEATLESHDGDTSWGEALPLDVVLAGLLPYAYQRKNARPERNPDGR